MKLRVKENLVKNFFTLRLLYTTREGASWGHLTFPCTTIGERRMRKQIEKYSEWPPALFIIVTDQTGKTLHEWYNKAANKGFIGELRRRLADAQECEPVAKVVRTQRMQYRNVTKRDDSL